MDVTHWVLGGMLVFSIVVAIIGLAIMTRRQDRDEAIDAVIFLAQRQLEDYLRQPGAGKKLIDVKAALRLD